MPSGKLERETSCASGLSCKFVAGMGFGYSPMRTGRPKAMLTVSNDDGPPSLGDDAGRARCLRR